MPSDVDSRATEPIEFLLIENDAGVTGATLRYDVTRISGGVVQWLNRTTATFVGSVPADGDRYRTLTQVDATNARGYYRDTAGGVNLATITNPTIPLPNAPLVYKVTYYQTAPTVRDPLDADVIVAGVTDTIRRRITNEERLAENGTLTSYTDAGAIEATSTVTDKTGGPIVLNAGDPARRTAEV